MVQLYSVSVAVAVKQRKTRRSTTTTEAVSPLWQNKSLCRRGRNTEIADQTPPKGALKIAEKLSKLGSINVHV